MGGGVLRRKPAHAVQELVGGLDLKVQGRAGREDS